MNFIKHQWLMGYGEHRDKKTYMEFQRIKKIKYLYAYYLPQFHPVEINDVNWGKGFTEWRNVSRALPLFQNHLQPRYPSDLGFYDLRCVDTIVEQARYARNYEIDGFFVYYYWFGGKKILETPLELILNNKDIDVKYAVFWTNENWTRSWDGSSNEIILRQNHSPDDDVNFIASVAKFFEDDRYIRYKGRPLLVVYRPSLFSNALETTLRWRDWCAKNGFEDPYLLMSEAFTNPSNYIVPNALGFDAAVEFPPHPGSAFIPQLLGPPSHCQSLGSDVQNSVYEYVSAVNAWSYPSHKGFKHFKCVFPAWDNSPRRQNGGASIFKESSPTLYKKWLTNALNCTENGDFVCINAWNEWAEGAFLEPDLFYGTAYLQATREALLESNSCVN